MKRLSKLSKKSRRKLAERMALCISIISPLSATPQIYKIWFLQNVQGVSLLTWMMFAFFAIPMLFYALTCKLKPLVYLYTTWIVLYIVIISGIIVNA